MSADINTTIMYPECMKTDYQKLQANNLSLRKTKAGWLYILLRIIIIIGWKKEEILSEK